MYVIGTAGHVDHGKSTLVKALTGIDPDRLKEEKEREMTIELGFAWLELPNGEEVGVVDVPGHESLVKNMLAGVGGIDLAMLVVAADEGVMPQTREHLAILDLLRVDRGFVALTKRDLVDDDWIELVTSDIEEALQPTTLAGARILPVSSTTGEGLDELKQALAELLQETPSRPDLGRPRLPIDRSFVMSGFGAVVTGTLIDGGLRVGQEVEIVPGGRRARIRGLQTHRRKIEEASPGRRLAVNLSGIGHEELHRGDVLAAPGWLTVTDALDAHVQMVRDAPAAVRHNATLSFHAGTAESPARLRLLAAEELAPGEQAWVQLKLQRRVPLVKGDLFILRNSRGTIGGGEVVEPRAKRHRRFRQETLDRLEVLMGGAPEEIVLGALSSNEPCAARSLSGATNLSSEQVREALAALVDSGRAVNLSRGDVQPASVLYSQQGFERLTGQIGEMLSDHHRRYPLRRGMLKEEVRSRLTLPGATFGLIVQRLVDSGALAEDGPLVRLPGQEVSLSPALRQEVDAYLAALRSSPHSPPTDVKIDAELLSHLLEQGQVVRTSPEVVFEAKAYAEMVERVVAHARARGSITVAEVRDLFGTSRKYALALMEYLDQQRVTRRVGDERVLR